MKRLFVWIAISVSTLFAQDRLTLREALEAVEKENPDVQIARLRVLEAEAGTRQVRSQYQPQLGLAVGTSYQTINLANIGLIFPGMPDRVGPFRTFNARPVLTQTVLDLSLLSRIRAVREREKELAFDVRTARENIQLAVMQLYLQTQQAQSRVAAAETRRVTAEAVLTQARDFEQAGTASKLDVARAEQQFFAEDTAVIHARRDVAVLKTALLRTVGRDPAQSVDLEPVAVPAASGPARQTRSELLALDSRLRSADLERQAAERQRLPRIGFSGDYGLAGIGPERSLSTFAVGATLTIPIWTGRRIQSEIEAAKARIEQTKSARRAQELRIAEEVRQSEIEMDAARRALHSSEQATRAARESLELARLRFSAGIATSLDTVIAQDSLAQAEDFEIRTRYDFLLARARLARAHGDIFSFFD